MAEIIEMHNEVDKAKSKIIEIRIRGEILPNINSLEFLLIDCLDGKMTLQITNKITKQFQIMIIDSENFFREIESLINLKKN